MTEVTNRNIVRAEIAAGGWEIAWGDLINEWDLVQLIVSVPTGSVGAWAAQQINAQLQKFTQSLSDVSDDLVKQAVGYLTELLRKRRAGERDFHGIGVKAGIATYRRHLDFGRGIKTKLPNNHQPYIGVRVVKPLPAGPIETPPQTGFEPSVYQEGDPGNGIGDYDLMSPADRVLAFDYSHSGSIDHLVCYRPGMGTIYILENRANAFNPVYQGQGIGGFDLKSPADQIFTFDYEHSGHTDHLVLYRPGTGTLWILKNQGGTFSPVYQEGSPGRGIGGYDLRSPADRAFAFDYNHSGKLDHLALYRPGTGTIWILQNNGGMFQPVYQEGSPGQGIGGFDLKSPADQAFAFDYDHSGKLDHIALYRPGTGTFWILANRNGSFHPVYREGDPGLGIGGYDLRSKADQALAMDYDHSGKLDHIVLYRPGTGTIWILKNSQARFEPVYQEGDPGNGIGGYDLRSPADRALVIDHDHDGKSDCLVLYRPGTGTIWILRRS